MFSLARPRRSYKEPRPSGSPRRDDPIAARYEAHTLALMGQTEEAVTALDRTMTGGIATFRCLILLAQIAWADGEPDVALGYLRDARTLAGQNAEHAHLQGVPDDLRAELIGECAEVPGFAPH